MKAFSPQSLFGGYVHEAFEPTNVTSCLATTSEKFRFTTSKKCRPSTSEKCRSNHYSAEMKGFHVTCCSLRVCWRWQLTNNGQNEQNLIQNSLKFWLKVTALCIEYLISRNQDLKGENKYDYAQHKQLCNTLIDRKYCIWLLCFSSKLFQQLLHLLVAKYVFSCCYHKTDLVLKI